MMDITNLFKASVKTVRTRNKALGTSTKPEDPNRIFPRTKEASKFQMIATKIVTSLAELHECLMKNRKAYLDTSIQLFNQVPKLSQADRAELDSTTQSIIKNCLQLLQELKRENTNLTANQQTKEHRTMVVSIIDQYFRYVSRTYQELKEQYLKRQHELNKVTKLEGDAMLMMRKPSFGAEHLASDMDSPRTYSGYNEDDHKTDDDRLNFSAADIQLFEKENTLLFNELNSLSEEVNQIHRKVVDIAALHQTLADKVLEQEKVIESIGDDLVSSTEHIREGNEQTRQALQNGSSFFLAAVFILLVLTIAVLFLDWYND